MLVKPPIEKLLEKVDNRYSLTYVVARRARQLVAGANPMTQSDSPNLVTLACEELAQDKVIAVPGIVDPIVPLRPEIEIARVAAMLEQQNKNEEINDIISDSMPASLNESELSESFEHDLISYIQTSRDREEYGDKEEAGIKRRRKKNSALMEEHSYDQDDVYSLDGITGINAEEAYIEDEDIIDMLDISTSLETAREFEENAEFEDEY